MHWSPYTVTQDNNYQDDSNTKSWEPLLGPPSSADSSLLNVISWTYGFCVFFLFCLTIFPDIHKLYTIAFSAQIIYALFLISLANRRTMRHTIVAFICAIPFIAVNAAMFTVLLAKVIELPHWLGFKLSVISGHDHTAISWAIILVSILMFLDLVIMWLCLKRFRESGYYHKKYHGSTTRIMTQTGTDRIVKAT